MSVKKNFYYNIMVNKEIHKSMANVFVGDMWLANVPYAEKGNFHKIRPVIISKIDENNIFVRKVTSVKNNLNEELDAVYPVLHKSYVYFDEIQINEADLLRKLVHNPIKKKKY